MVLKKKNLFMIAFVASVIIFGINISVSNNVAFAIDSPSTTPVLASISCGEAIQQSIKLSSNLNCSGDGILVGKNDITIDLNGHKITGPGTVSGASTSKIGIMLGEKSGVKITGPGIIEGFQTGIMNTGGKNNAISGVTFTKDQIGSDNAGATDTSITGNTFLANHVGFASQSSTNSKIYTNSFISNDLAGIVFVNSGRGDVSMNSIYGSVTGMFVDGQSTENKITYNNVFKNSVVDLNNANGLPVNVNDNLFTDNNCNTSIPVGLCLGR